MNTAVLLRVVEDPGLRGGIFSSGHALDAASQVALAQAVALAAQTAGASTGIAAGPSVWDEALREARALGLGTIVRTWSPALERADVLATAAAIAAALPPATDVVFAGQASSDHGSGLLPAAVAELLDWPLLCDVVEVERRDDDGLVAQVRKSGGRRSFFRLRTPAVLVAARLPAPAVYPRLAVRLAARKSAISEFAAEERGLMVGAGDRLQLAGYGPARPLTRQLIQPAATANPSERLRQLMSGGMGNRGGQKLDAEGSGPEAMARQLAELLAREGLLR